MHASFPPILTLNRIKKLTHKDMAVSSRNPDFCWITPLAEPFFVVYRPNTALASIYRTVHQSRDAPAYPKSVRLKSSPRPGLRPWRFLRPRDERISWLIP